MNVVKTRREKFTEVYQKNTWGGKESVSGTGSDLSQTEDLRRRLPELLKELGVKSLIDAPCGDLNWMGGVAWEEMGVKYIGVDIVAELIEKLRARYPGRQFECCDLVTDILPKAELIFCRDCLVHLPLAEICEVIRNFARSGATWLLTTTFPKSGVNKDVRWSGWRPLNLEMAPFNFPRPERAIVEGCTEDGGAHADKSLGLWRLADLQKMACPHSLTRGERAGGAALSCETCVEKCVCNPK
jgi:hypothetical protein